MTADKDSVVLVSYELAHEDMFRIGLWLAKWRLLIGGIAVLVLITFLVSVFILIGEDEILFKTSPLFIGIPLIALGGPVLRLHAASRKYVSSLNPAQRQFQFAFQPNSDSYKLTNGESLSQIAWKDVMQVLEKPRFFLIYRSKFDVGFIPKRAFRAADISLFRDIVRSQLGDRARVAAEAG